jgi:preprotein translocase subunit SecG
MRLLIWILTALIVLDCGLLMLLILIQLPKKEAGMGTAFGGGATDALFGAGSGNVLTKLTKYTSAIFLGLALVLSILIVRQSNERGRSLQEELEKKAKTPMAIPTLGGPTSPLPVLQSAGSTNPLLTNPTNLPSAATNSLPKPTNGAKTTATPAPATLPTK